MQPIKIKFLRDGATLPRRATAGSAGYDITAAIDQPVWVRQGEVVTVPAGIAIEVPEGYAAFMFGRSGLGIRHGVIPANAVGVVDSDYRGEIMVGLTCLKPEGYQIVPGERIAQMVILPVALPEIAQAQELSETGRGAGGFGSTGR